MRTDSEFETVFNNVEERVCELDLMPFSLPRKQRLPSTFGGQAEDFVPESAEQYFRKTFCNFLDVSIMQLQSRFNCASPSITTYMALEDSLFGNLDVQTIERYPELSANALLVEIPMFQKQFKCTTLLEVNTAFCAMTLEVRALFPHTEKLLRL